MLRDPAELSRASILRAGGAGLVATALCALVMMSSWYQVAREQAFDILLGWFHPVPATRGPIVVDIDRKTLASWGGRRQLRARLADLVGQIAARQPAAIGLDILIDDAAEVSPLAEARRLIAASSNPDIARLADQMPDPAAALPAAIAKTRLVLGAALDPDAAAPTAMTTTPIFARGAVDVSQLWPAPGLAVPSEDLRRAAAGLGVLALAADDDGNIRRVPLLTAAGRSPVPGLAVEVTRVAEQASSILLAPSLLAVGGRRIRLPPDGMLRLVPGDPARSTQRTISALDLAGAPSARLRGAIVLIGSSAPELGGLRSAHGGRLVASVQLQADAIAQIASAIAPFRPDWMFRTEIALAIALALLGIAIGLLMSPGASIIAVVTVAGAWLTTALGLGRATSVLLDPLAGGLMMAAGCGVTALVVAGDTWRRQALLRRRFEQHLSPDVVRRIVQNPSLVRLQGELREISVLFTDVEGFTSMTERAAPAQLVAALDAYFEGLARIVVEHGGMVDKVVGDGVHAIFNAPVDLDQHPQRAFACAQAIARFAEEFRGQPTARAIGFGRTRIGLETGKAIVGDVGGGRKLDYTAHGNVVNAASRFESANKELGTTICVGPGMAAELPDGLVRSLGAISIRGRSERQPVFEPWPASYTVQDRKRYRAAMAHAEVDRLESIAALTDMAHHHHDDRAIALLIERLAQRD